MQERLLIGTVLEQRLVLRLRYFLCHSHLEDRVSASKARPADRA